MEAKWRHLLHSFSNINCKTENK